MLGREGTSPHWGWGPLTTTVSARLIRDLHDFEMTSLCILGYLYETSGELQYKKRKLGYAPHEHISTKANFLCLPAQ